MSEQVKIISAQNTEDFFTEMDRTLKTERGFNLGFVFASDKFLDNEFVTNTKDLNIKIFGTSSREEIFGNRLLTNSITAMLLNLDNRCFQLKRFNDINSMKIGKDIGEWATKEFKNPAILLLVGGGGFKVNTEKLLLGLNSFRTNLSIFGGLASMLSNLTTSYVFDEEGYFDDGVLALALDQDILQVKGIAVSGWKEVGTTKQISKSEGNTVYEIEGLPALEFYEKYFNVGSGGEDELLSVMEYPLLVYLPDGSKVMRTPIRFNNETKSITYAADIPNNSKVKFCSPNISDTIDSAINELQTFRDTENLNSAQAVLLFDCAIRSHSFGSYMQKEIEFISNIWQAPMVGFSSWGEIGNRKSETCGFHNTTISLVVIQSQNKSSSKILPNYTSQWIQKELSEFEDNSDPETMKRHIQSLRKQKTMLSHFLHLNTDDLDRANANLAFERQRSDNLLLNILPESIAERLKGGETKIADQFDNVSVLFADLVGFTVLSDRLKASEIVRILNNLFQNFDHLADRYGVEKIKTIGDAYMAAAGLPEPCGDHAIRTMKLAKGMLKIIDLFNSREKTSLELRIGIHSGSVVAGVIGKNKFIYDLWGDTVNIASRMESHGKPGKIHISDITANLLRDRDYLDLRGDIDIKGKGLMKTWFLK